MSGKYSNSGSRDTVTILAVLAVFAIAYFVLREPSIVPVEPIQANDHAGHQAMGGTDQLANLPTDYNGLVGIGNQSMDQGNYSVAAECYRRALDIDGSDDNVRVDFGACLHFMGLDERAMAEFRDVMSRNQSHAISRFNAGIVFNGMNQPDSAIYYFEQYLAMDPKGKAADQARSIMEKLKNSTK